MVRWLIIVLCGKTLFTPSFPTGPWTSCKSSTAQNHVLPCGWWTFYHSSAQESVLKGNWPILTSVSSGCGSRLPGDAAVCFASVGWACQGRARGWGEGKRVHAQAWLKHGGQWVAACSSFRNIIKLSIVIFYFFSSSFLLIVFFFNCCFLLFQSSQNPPGQWHPQNSRLYQSIRSMQAKIVLP